MPGRSNSSGDYRYGYNGMEKDDEVSGNGNSYTTDFRQYDPRLGRWKSLDPLMHMFPWMSPYVAFDNNPIYYVDPYGLSAGTPIDGGEVKTADGQKSFLHDLSDVEEGQEVNFSWTDSKGSHTSNYVYKNKEWVGKTVHNNNYTGKSTFTKTVESSVKNRTSEAEYAVINTADKVGDQGSGVEAAELVVKEKAGVVTNPEKPYRAGGETSDEYFINKKGKANRLHNDNGTIRKNTPTVKTYKKIKYINTITEKVGTVSDLSELGYNVIEGNVDKVLEQVVIYSVDKLADAMIRSATPAGVVIGVAVKGALYLYENWDSVKATWSWLTSSTPSYDRHTVVPRPPDGIYQDTHDPNNYRPLVNPFEMPAIKLSHP